MKHKYLLILCSLFLPLLLSGQSFKFVETEVDTFQVAANLPDGFTIFFDITNITSDDTLDLVARRITNDMAPGHTSFFCWDLCYDTTVSVSESFITLLPGDTTGFTYVTFNPNNVNGSSSVTMLFATTDSSGESIRRTYSFAATGATSNPSPIVRKVGIQGIYPNPADRAVSVLYQMNANGNSGYIQLVNLIGQEMMRRELPPLSDKLNLSTANLPSGMYFVNLILDGKQKASRKLIITH